MFPCLCKCDLGEVSGYMECSCYNVLGGSLKVGDTDGYPLVWCIGRQLSYHQQGMTLCLERKEKKRYYHKTSRQGFSSGRHG